jgi:uncharacterized membrane protein YphA (DoxX/SURF4 family)
MPLPFPIPMAVIYAGLAGVLLAMLVATAQNKWQWRVFALLALRLAIGWHFLFEGLHKLNSTAVGQTETNKPFTSASYFNIGDGPGAEMARKQFLGDPVAKYTERLAKPRDVTLEEFKKLTTEQQAELCPKAVIDLVSGGEASKVTQAKADYAAWLYGAAPRDAKFKDVSGDTPVSPEQWLDYIHQLEKEYESRVERRSLNLGKGEGLDVKRTAAIKTELNTVRADLAKATDDFIAELQKQSGATPPEVKKPIEDLDRMAKWGITAIGAGLLLGLFTRLWCVAGIGFLVMTYLSSPPWPWLPPGPPSEGNPLFINKNLIEAIGLFVVLMHPTGRWLGLDALIDYLLFGRKKKDAVAK